MTQEGVIGVQYLRRSELMDFTNPVEFLSDILPKLRLEGIFETVAYCSHFGLTGCRFDVGRLLLIPRGASMSGLGRLSRTFHGNDGGCVRCIVRDGKGQG